MARKYDISVQLTDIEAVNPHEIPPVLPAGSLCLEELRKPDERVDSVLDSLHLPPVGNGCEGSLVFLHQSHQPDRTLLVDLPQTLPDGLTFLEELEQLDPPDVNDLGGERNNGLGLQRDPGDAAHQAIPVLRGWPTTAPAEGEATGTTHVITAM